MKYEDLPARWKDKVRKWLLSKGEHQREKLTYSDFNAETVARIEFEDGSQAVFYYPLVIQAPEFNEVGVFTEHCGYHIFALSGIQVEIQPRSRPNKEE